MYLSKSIEMTVEEICFQVGWRNTYEILWKYFIQVLLFVGDSKQHCHAEVFSEEKKREGGED